MDLTIYPLGDAAFVERILNAVAIYTGQGDFAITVATAAMLGVFAAAIQSLMKNGKEIDVAPIFVGIGAFILLFDTVTTRVTIEDRTTGAVRVVDNVPAGVSVPAYLISNIGNNISSGFESIYTSVSTTTQNPMSAGGSYADSLQSLVDIRSRVYSSQLMDAASANMGGSSDFHQSVFNYLKECTYTKYDLDLVDDTKLSTLPLREAIRFESEIFYTQWIGPTGPEDVTCSQAYVLLDEAFNKLFASTSQVEQVLNKALRSIDSTPGAPNWEAKLNNTNAELLSGMGASGISAQQMALTMIVQPIMLEAAQGKYSDFQDEALAISMTNAIEKRNLSWAAQASFFQETIYPMMTFFEGLSFAITPFIAFLMVMGAFGIKLGIKYFMLLIWIQLWMPLLSIVDMFITEGASSELVLAGSATGVSANSIYFMNAAYDAAKTWIGTGSYMATAVPMISLFLVSGSMYGASSLANSISAGTAKGADQAADSIQPDAFNMGSLNQLGAASSTQFGTGSAVAGREGNIGSIQLGAAASQGSSSARQDLATSTNAFNSSLSDTLNNTSTSQDQLALTEGLGRSISASDSNIASAVSTQAQTIGSAFKLDDSTTQAVAGVLGGVLSGGLSAGNGTAKLQGALEGKVSDETRDAVMQTVSDTIQRNNQAGFTDTDKAELKSDIAANFSEQNSDVFGTGEQSTQAQSIMQSSQEARQASDAYQQSQSAEKRLSAMGDFDPRTVASGIDNSDYKAMRDSLDEQGVDTTGLAQTYKEAIGDGPMAERLATLQMALASENAETRQAGIDAVSSALGWTQLDQSGTEGSVSNVGQSNIDPSQNNRDGMRNVRTDDGTRPDEIANSDVVGAAHTANSSGVSAEDASNRGGVNAQAAALAGQRIIDQAATLDSGPTAFEIMGMADNAGTKLQETGNGIAAMAVGAGDIWNNLSGTFGDHADRVKTNFENAGDAANSEQGMLDRVGAFFGSLGDSYGETTASLWNGVGDAFTNGVDAGQEAYASMRGDLKESIMQDGRNNGLNELQSDYFAESQMAFFDQAVGGTALNNALGTGAYDSLNDSREALVGAYSVAGSPELANGMADVINNASGNIDFAGGRTGSIGAYNNAAPLSFNEDQIQELQETLSEDIVQRIMGSLNR
ncbi:conjugal transfer protein TraG N-terminal domain-containing protein [Marinobacter salicampi]|uniref:conjugal transfer protein TraG N-terminal domain-containing protein n=1 Tax=Marinobacter salicampi TaxID=435907 RepID=UPI00140B7B71|nr:conjugal transfer protein TraG N-terminal domain-containing protein [Marinobacter salicampi]